MNIIGFIEFIYNFVHLHLYRKVEPYTKRYIYACQALNYILYSKFIISCEKLLHLGSFNDKMSICAGILPERNFDYTIGGGGL